MVLDAELIGHGTGCAGVVTGEQDKANAEALKGCESGGSGGFDGIGDFEKSSESAIDSHAKRGGMGLGSCAAGDAEGLEEGGFPDGDDAAIDLAGDALRGGGLKIGGGIPREIFFFGGIEHGAGEGMFAGGFEPCGEEEKLVL